MGKQNGCERECMGVNVNECEFSIVVMTALNTVSFVCCVLSRISRAFCSPLASRGLICFFTNSNVCVARSVCIIHESVVVLAECCVLRVNTDLFSFVVTRLIISFVPRQSVIPLLPYKMTTSVKLDTSFSADGCSLLMSLWWIRFQRCEYKCEYCELPIQYG